MNKKFLALLSAGALTATLLAGCGSGGNTDPSTAEPSGEEGATFTTIESGKLIMSTNAQFPPYELVSDGEGYEGTGYEGIDVEIAYALAQKLGRPLADVDEKIIEAAGCSIPHIFASEGEEGFRVREYRALAQIAKESGQVISAGGGIVTRPENRDPMEENSVVVWLRRDLDKLPTDGRPVSQSVPREELYRRRVPLYEAMAQVTVDNNGTVEDTVDEIIRRVMG